MVTHDSKEKLSEEIEAKIQYLKVKVVYEMGREVSVKNFCENAHLLECINDIDGTRTSYILLQDTWKRLLHLENTLSEKINKE